jgi:pimeloyl-ACP methyl ester carboxylesterase
MRGEFVDVGDGRLYYYAAGTRAQAEPVVLLHGLATSSHLWARVVPLMPPDRRVVVMDLMGYGRSDRPDGADVSIRGHAERTMRLFDQLGIRAVALVGHGLGGGIALRLALREPARVSRLCLVDTVAFDRWTVGVLDLARASLPLVRHMPGGLVGSILRASLRRGYASPEQGAHSVDQFIRPFIEPGGARALAAHLAALDARETAELTAQLGTVTMPTAIVWGGSDPFLSATLGRRLQERIPGATLDVVPGAGHFVPDESPERLADVLTALLAR